MSPTHRRLIAVDAQNLLGCHPSHASAASWEFAIEEVLDAVAFDEDSDHVIIAVAPDWAFIVKALAPSARLMVQRGRHGADRALCHALDDAHFIADRYSEVVVASGSHRLRKPVRALADAGVATTVACLPQQTSRALTDSAAHVTWLDRPTTVLGNAARVTPSAARKPHALVPMGAATRTAPARTRLGLAA